MHLGRATLLFLFVTVTADAAVLRVGPGKPYASPSKAIAAAVDGDTIEIDAGTYTGDVCAIRKNRLTLRGVNGRAKLDAAGANADSKGIWVIYGNDTVVENIEFTGAQVPDQNGSGIWLEGYNLTVRNCYFHHNEDGILTGRTGTVLIEYSEFAYNGNGEGYTHNLYIGAAESFTFRYCYSHHAIAGHLVKSRAAVNYILYNRLSEEPGGNGSFELDLPNGGTSYVIGNIIQKSVESENYASVAYFEEGPAAGAPGRQLYVVNNTFSNAAPSRNVLFVFTPGGLTTPAVIKNNIFTGLGDITNQANAAVSSNYQGGAPGFTDPDTFDYRLLPGSPAIDAGADLGDPKLAPTMQYVHPACAAGRETIGPIDMGAYEFGGQVPAPPSANLPERCPGGSVQTPTFIQIEAEAGTLAAPMNMYSDSSASGGQYVSSRTLNAGTAAFSFNISKQGTYYVWARVLAASPATDSFFVSVDGGAEKVFDIAERRWSPNWQWTELNARLNGLPLGINPWAPPLAPGQHILRFRGREVGAQLDQIIITDDQSFTPSGISGR